MPAGTTRLSARRTGPRYRADGPDPNGQDLRIFSSMLGRRIPSTATQMP
jgi:hypothetical protein